KGPHVLASVTHLEEIRLGLQPVLPSDLPHRRQYIERDYVDQGRVAEGIEDRRASRVRPPACAEESESGEDLAGHQQPDENQAATAAANGPLFKVHLMVIAGDKADGDTQYHDCRNDAESGGAWGHCVPRDPSEERDASSRYARHMNSGVSSSHSSNQK